MVDPVDTTVADDDSPLEAVVVGGVTAVTLTVAFGLMFLGVPWFWVAFPVGFGGVLPMALGLVRLYERRQESESAEPADDPIATLRERYARGELSDAEFERQVEQLLETESPDERTAERLREARHEHGIDADGAQATESTRERDYE